MTDQEIRRKIADNNEMLYMIDGAYEVVELFGFRSESPAQKEWSKRWIEKAKRLGAKTF